MDVRNKMVEFAFAHHENQQQAAVALFDVTMVADRGSFKKFEDGWNQKNPHPQIAFLWLVQLPMRILRSLKCWIYMPV